VRPRFDEELRRLGGTHEFVVAPGNALRLDSLLAAQLDTSRTRAATLIEMGAVTVNGSHARAGFRPRPGDRIIVVVPRVEARQISAEDIPIDVVFEDDHIVVVNKAAGMVVHPAPGNWSGTLVNALKGRVDRLSTAGGEERAGIVHRLDKDTSGLLIVAKTERVHRVLSAAIAARRVARRYAVLCWGHLKGDEVVVDKPIGRDPRERKRMAVVSGGRSARTDFFRIARFEAADLLRAHLRTGRTHQIRVHLSALGHPVVGDDAYGGGGGRKLAALPPRRHFLHAAWLMFHHPATGDLLDLRAPLPADLHRSLLQVAGMGRMDGYGHERAGPSPVSPLRGHAAAGAVTGTGVEGQSEAGRDNLDLLDHFGFFQTTER
jgi:23S rRNA pseudouridine1911/1915/1917 synthase